MGYGWGFDPMSFAVPLMMLGARGSTSKTTAPVEIYRETYTAANGTNAATKTPDIGSAPTFVTTYGSGTVTFDVQSNQGRFTCNNAIQQDLRVNYTETPAFDWQVNVSRMDGNWGDCPKVGIGPLYMRAVISQTTQIQCVSPAGTVVVSGLTVPGETTPRQWRISYDQETFRFYFKDVLILSQYYPAYTLASGFAFVKFSGNPGSYTYVDSLSLFVGGLR